MGVDELGPTWEAVVSPSLLKKIKFPPSLKAKKRINKRFDLGINDWNDSNSKDDFLPPKKIPCMCFAQLTSN